MNAVIMDNVTLGDESIVGALSFISEGKKIPSRSLVVGNPGKVIRKVTDEMIAWKTQGTVLYQALPAVCFETLKRCLPLKSPPAKKNNLTKDYINWKKIKK
jgi:carbonic anhydrase/acetyltransferase-like protein (isoleucine patch superfamily)